MTARLCLRLERKNPETGFKEYMNFYGFRSDIPKGWKEVRKSLRG
jgi:hypothetical protein